MLQVQDIISIKNLTFKNTGLLDIKVNGHPVLVIHVTDTHFYFLKISSHPPKDEEDLELFALKKDKYNKFKIDTCYVNLRDIYKQQIGGHAVHGYIIDEVFDDIMDKFYFYQECIGKDEFYEEIIGVDLTRELEQNK